MKPPADHIEIPPAFRAEHLNQWQLMDALELDEPSFWRAYTMGEIPAGVPLLASIGAPLIVWPAVDIERWILSGKPGNADLQDRTRRVYAALVLSIEAEYGRPPEQLAELIQARN